MLADSSTRSGARSTGRAASGTRSRSACSQQVGERRRLIEVPRLREVPRHELDLARAAAEGRHALARRRADGLRRVPVERRDVDRRAGRRRPQRGVRVQADEQIRLVVVGDRRALVDRHAAVVVSRQQHAEAEARLDRRLRRAARPRASGPFPSRRPRSSTPSSSPPWPGSIAIVRNGRRRLAERRRQIGRRLRRGGAGAAAGGVGLRGDEVDRPAACVVSTGWLAALNPAKRGPRSTASVVASTRRTARTSPGDAWRGQRRVRRVERVGVELDRQVLGRPA